MAIVRAASRALLPTFRLLCCGQHLLSHFDSSTVRTVRQVDKLAFGRGDLKNHGTSTDLLGHNARRCYSAQATHQSIEAAPVPPDYQTYVDRVKARLETERADLPVGKNGRDDEDLLLWFLRDRNFDVDAAVAKLVEALEWRREFGVGEITEASVSKVASIGEAYVHSYPAKDGRPVIIVISSKQFPNDERLIETRQKHCVYLIEKALTQLSPGGESFLGIFDLRGFQPKNGDLKFVNFLVT
ncbi:hypothetical protein KC19_12G007100 [Ceratodon purpureus]|uniref:CRAL-TRIO domain-containing protein n=1 Tax=Ceratodon purpureus TaxID=3225 RepID=A0A8T0G391_CERPU|nr:hypothetical protein KC19_12G007100 [Ceratodon purpureus]